MVLVMGRCPCICHKPVFEIAEWTELLFGVEASLDYTDSTFPILCCKENWKSPIITALLSRTFSKLCHWKKIHYGLSTV